MKPWKIALEEHVALPETLESASTYLRGRPTLPQKLLDIHGALLAEMDASGIEMSVLSLNADGIQGILTKPEAITTARRANDYLAEQVTKNSRRFQALAALPMQDPEEAAKELTRCVKDLGMKGALANGYTQLGEPDNILYYDQPEFWDFWGTVEALGVPFYLHARDPIAASARNLQGHPWLWQSRWAFGVETATHALRLMASGLFDKYPRLTIILGHLGEMLPNFMWRIDHRINAWGANASSAPPIKRRMNEYLRNNFYITTSGNFCTSTLMNVIQWMGSDRIMFSVDYPFEKMSQAGEWFDSVDVICDADWEKIARKNAIRLLKLESAKATSA